MMRKLVLGLVVVSLCVAALDTAEAQLFRRGRLFSGRQMDYQPGYGQNYDGWNYQQQQYYGQQQNFSQQQAYQQQQELGRRQQSGRRFDRRAEYNNSAYQQQLQKQQLQQQQARANQAAANQKQNGANAKTDTAAAQTVIVYDPRTRQYYRIVQPSAKPNQLTQKQQQAVNSVRTAQSNRNQSAQNRSRTATQVIAPISPDEPAPNFAPRLEGPQLTEAPVLTPAAPNKNVATEATTKPVPSQSKSIPSTPPSPVITEAPKKSEQTFSVLDGSTSGDGKK